MKKKQTYSLIGQLLDSDNESSAILAYYLMKGLKGIEIDGKDGRVYSFIEQEEEAPWRGRECLILKNYDERDGFGDGDWFLLWISVTRPHHLNYEIPNYEKVSIPIT